MLAWVFLSGSILSGLSIGALPSMKASEVNAAVAMPKIEATPALHGALVARISTTIAGAVLHYTVDGAEPSASSQIYQAPFLIATKMTVKAIAIAQDKTTSRVAMRIFAPAIAPGTLVWSEEFANRTGAPAEPNPQVWTYDTGNSGFGNHELENYCAWGSNASPCTTAAPNAYIGTDGYLHIVARQSSAGVYTSARMKSQGLFSFQYGRIEMRARVPEAQGFWPAGWTLGNNITTVDWPACGEQDILERVNGATQPDWNEGSVHGIGFTGDTGLGKKVMFALGQTAADWHTYGMIWKKGSVAYYVDDPAHPYVTYTADEMKSGQVWPFDAGQSNFFLLNLAIGGDWPGPPNATTPFPAEMLVDYVRIYTD